MIAIISNFKFSKTQKVIFNAQCIETGTSSFQMNHSFERNLQPICSKMTFWNFKPTFQTGSSNFLLDSNFVRKKVLYSLIASVSKFEILKLQQFIFHVQILKTGSSKTFWTSVFVKNMLSLCNNFMTIFSKSRPRVDVRNFHCSKKQQFIFNTQYIHICSSKFCFNLSFGRNLQPMCSLIVMISIFESSKLQQFIFRPKNLKTVSSHFFQKRNLY